MTVGWQQAHVVVDVNDHVRRALPSCPDVRLQDPREPNQ